MELKSKIKDYIKGLFGKRSTLESYCEKYTCLSFDIFDTLITRKCGNPQNLFSLVENKYNAVTDKPITDFKKIRVESEEKARACCNRSEIVLDDIYEQIAYFYDTSVCQQLKQLEIETEIEECIGIDKMAFLYNCLVSNKSKNIFILSDMYLPYFVIAEIFKKNNLRYPKKIYISCEVQKTKRKGDLFDLLIEENKLCRKNVLHIGDNLKSDYFQAKRHGINSFLIC